MSETNTTQDRMHPHPSPILAEHVRIMRAELATIEHAIYGLLSEQNQDSPGSLERAESVEEGLRLRFEALSRHLTDVERLSEEIAAKGVLSAREGIRSAPELLDAIVAVR